MTTIRINYLYPLFIFCIFFLTNNLAYADCDSSDNDAALGACLLDTIMGDRSKN